jgi:hypothetical protein
MFAINGDETQQLRQHERRVVEYVESIIADYAAQIMAMQVQCNAPDCVPIETVVLILYPKAKTKEGVDRSVGIEEESSHSKDGSSFQFKILKPIAEVTKEDVELSMPLALRGGSLAATGRQLRKDLLTRIDQLFPTEDDVQSRQWMSQFLQESLQQYVDNSCQLPNSWNEENSNHASQEEGEASVTAIEARTFPQGNITLRRPVDDEADKVHME